MALGLRGSLGVGVLGLFWGVLSGCWGACGCFLVLGLLEFFFRVLGLGLQVVRISGGLESRIWALRQKFSCRFRALWA